MQSRTLSTVSMVTNGTTQKVYTLGYTSDGFYTKLISIDLTGLNGEKHNPTVINWDKLNSTTTPAFSSQDITYDTHNYSVNNGNTEYDDIMAFVDIDNDGVSEVVKGTSYASQNDKLEVYKSSGNAYTLLQTIGIYRSNTEINNTDVVVDGSFQLIPCDVNSDGINDLIAVRGTEYETGGIDGGIQYWNFNVNVFISANGQLERVIQRDFTTADFQPLHFTVGDFNGDAVNELLCINEAGKIDIYHIDIPGTQFTLLSTTLTGIYIDESNKVVDVNGNGIPELYCNGHLWEYNSTTNSFAAISFAGDLTSDYVADINGDGKTDMLYYNSTLTTWSVKLSTGNGFTDIPCPISSTPTSGSNNEYYILGDYNGDGLLDIAEVLPNASPEAINIYYFNGTSFTKGIYACPGYFADYNSHPMSVYQNKFTPFVDFNGDGKGELVLNNAYGVSIVSFTTNETERNISSITNGLNQKNTIHYKLLTDNTVYTNSSGVCAYPVIKTCIPVPVVSASVFEAGDVSETTSYNYKGLRIHTQGKGMLGFEEFTAQNSLRNRKTVSSFGYDPIYFQVSPTQQITSTLSGDLISTETFSNTVTPLGGKRIFPYIASHTTTDNLSGLSTTTDYQTYDDYGNPTLIKTTTGNLITTQTATYIPKGSWCPNKPLNMSVSKEQNTEISAQSTDFTYDDNGNLTSETLNPNDANHRTTTYSEPNQFGQPTKVVTTANGNSRTAWITMTPSGRFIQSKTNVLGQTTTYDWGNENRGLPLSETNRLGTTTYSYDGLGQLTGTTFPDGLQKTNSAHWASMGNAYGAKYYTYEALSGSAPLTSWYDALGREVVKETVGLNGNTSRAFTAYYPDGKLYRVSEPTFGTTADKWATTYTQYDSYGRPEIITTPLGNDTISYSGTTTTVKSPAGTKQTILNTAGQVQTNTINGKAVSYTYYPSGLAKTATPDGGQAISMQYDLQGNRTKLIDPDAGTIRTQYNGFGELLLEKQLMKAGQDSVATINTYDETTGLVQNVVRGAETTSYGYDNLKRLSTIEIAGKHKQTFTYGDYDRLTNLKEEIGLQVYNKQVGYDDYGRVNKEIFPSGYTTFNTYDTYGNLTEEYDANRSIWKAVEANAQGQLTKVDKGIKQTIYGYDDRGMTTSIQTAGIVNLSYVFDTKGNLFSRTDALTNQKEQFAYDALNRLTNWDIRQNTTNALLKANSLTYDATSGNITAKSDLDNFTMSYGGYRANGSAIGPHALATISGVPTGTPTDNLAATYTDFRKIETLGEGTKNYAVTYGVDQQRRKSVQTVDGVTTTRYYLGDYEEEMVGTTVRKIHYLRGAIYVQNNGTDSLYYTYTDNQGSVIALTDQSGSIMRKYAYDPWGIRRKASDWTQKDDLSHLIINRGYTGHEHIDAFGIINMNGRVYDPSTAQFFSPDPFIQSGGDWINYNRYGYCFDNPLTNIDPSGYLKEPNDDGWIPKLMPSTNWNYLFGVGGSLNHRSASCPYAYDWNNGIYKDSQGNIAAYWEVRNNYIEPNAAYQFSGDAASNFVRGIVSARNSDIVLLGRRLNNDNLYEFIDYNISTGKFYIPGTSTEFTSNASSNLGGGGKSNLLEDINTGLSAFGALNSIGINIAQDYVSYGFKSANGWQEFSKLASNQQAWRAARVFGKTGANVLKYAKGLGIGAAALSTTYSLGNAGVYYYNGGKDMSVGIKSLLDVAMTGVGFCGPIGFGISVAYFVLDTATDGFGGYGKIK